MSWHIGKRDVIISNTTKAGQDLGKWGHDEVISVPMEKTMNDTGLDISWQIVSWKGLQ
jgi:hypothetical protein